VEAETEASPIIILIFDATLEFLFMISIATSFLIDRLVCDMYLFKFNHRHWDAIRNYPYAGLDFLLDENYKLVFLEANAVSGGIYVMEKAFELILDSAPNFRLYVEETDFVRLFVDASLTFYRMLREGYPKKVLITTPLSGAPLLMPERFSIAQEFRRRGIYAVIANRNNFFVLNGKIAVRLGSRYFYPDLIIRRNTSFPKNITQPIINSSEVGQITGSKFRTYRVVRDFIKNHKKAPFKLPETYFAKNVDDAISISEDMLSRGKEVVVKPNKGEKGQDIIFIRSASDAETKLKRAFGSKRITLVVQEKIDILTFPRESNRYAFDIRTYAYLGRFVGAHIRRAGIPMGQGLVEEYGVSNVSRGGLYVPILLVPDGPRILKWGDHIRQIYLFKSIKIDNYAFGFDSSLWKKLREATELVVLAIGYALMGFSDNAKTRQ